MISDYNSRVLAHFDAPRNSGELANATMGEAQSAAWGDRIVWFVQTDASGRIERASWQCSGGVATIASASWLSETLPGQPIAEALAVDPLMLAEALNLPATKRYAPLLVQEALTMALNNALKALDK